MSAVFPDVASVGKTLDFETPRQFHVERRHQPADRERMALLRAERACLTILIIGEMVLSDIAMTRLHDELCAIQRALDLKRPKLGLQSAKDAEVAA